MEKIVCVCLEKRRDCTMEFAWYPTSSHSFASITVLAHKYDHIWEEIKGRIIDLNKHERPRQATKLSSGQTPPIDSAYLCANVVKHTQHEVTIQWDHISNTWRFDRDLETRTFSGYLIQSTVKHYSCEGTWSTLYAVPTQSFLLESKQNMYKFM